MADEFSGDMILKLLRTVEKTVPRPGNVFSLDPEHRKVLTLMRDAMRNNGREMTPLKAAWLDAMDQYLSDNPSPDLIRATLEKLWLLSPPDSGTGPKATSVNLF